MKSYDYTRRQGAQALPWDDFVHLCGELAEELAHFETEVIVGIARAGLLPAALVACIARPVWRVPLTAEVTSRVVAVVDEIADTGETQALVSERARALGASRVITATLVSHSWAQPAPDVCALVSDKLIMFPWDQRVLAAGKWQLHPEIAGALEIQGKASPDLEL